MAYRRKKKLTPEVSPVEGALPQPQPVTPPGTPPETGAKRITFPDGTVREYLDTGTVRTIHTDGTVTEDDPLYGWSVILSGKPTRKGLNIRPEAPGWKAEGSRGFGFGSRWF